MASLYLIIYFMRETLVRNQRLLFDQYFFPNHGLVIDSAVVHHHHLVHQYAVQNVARLPNGCFVQNHGSPDSASLSYFHLIMNYCVRTNHTVRRNLHVFVDQIDSVEGSLVVHYDEVVEFLQVFQVIQHNVRGQEEVFGDSNVLPKSLESEGKELFLLGQFGEDFLLQRNILQLNVVDHTHVEDVHACIYEAPDEFFGLLDELGHFHRFLIMDHNSETRGIIHVGYQESDTSTVRLVEFHHLLQGVLANDIRIQNEKTVVIRGVSLGRGIFISQVFLGQLDGPSSVQGLFFD